MDCNREEAVRAKQLAEKKMENKDFSGALKIALKAQQLYPELENISQLILVCEVHCSAEKKSYGNDKDWYGILKVEPSADDVSIKKQYRKLALILHPDKNQFSGSTDAFKLIGEAQRVLLDREKRMIHDSKRRAHGTFSAPSWTPKHPNRQPNVQQHQHQHQHPWNQGRPVNLSGGHSGNFAFTPQGFPNVGGHKSTFWTACPFCAVRYQFYRDDAFNKTIQCQSCKKSFFAYESYANTSQPHIQKTNFKPVHVPPKPAEGQKRNFTTKPIFEKKEKPKAKANVSRKRKKRIEESSESSDSSDSSESDEEDVQVHSGSEGNGVPKTADKTPNFSDFEYFGEQPRRSSRAKRNVSYKENTNDIDIDIDNDDDDADDDGDDDDGNDDDDGVTPSNPAEKPVDEGDTFWKEEVAKVAESNNKKSEKDDKRNSDRKGVETENGDDIEDEAEPQVFECPDSEFNDFEKFRKEETFRAGQIWACYDNEDAMPRFYAFIKKVSAGFKLQLQWLKPEPVTADEKKWVNAELPVSCGRFKLGKLDKAEDVLSFSHSVSWEAGPKPKSFNIIPRKSETWALFKNWSMTWHSSDSSQKYEYEFVEIVSDYDEDSGVRVSYLEKVKGFVSLFRQKEGGEMVISGSEKYRFAHMIPSCRMSGKEREGVPEGSYELDPACLPASTFEE